jgi:PAS domain S-box-containing protein
MNSAVVEIKNQKMVITIARDIEERKKLEEALKKQNKLFEFSESYAKLGSWEKNILNDELAWSSQAYKIFEMEEERKADYNKFMSKVLPEDRAKLKLAQNDLIKNGIEINIDYRIKSNSGGIKFLHEEGYILEKDSKGKTVKIAGFVQDVTYSKELLNRVLNNEQSLKNILTSTDDFIFTLDKKQVYTSIYSNLINKGIFKAEDFIGKNPDELLGKEKAKLHKKMNIRALQGESLTYEWQNTLNDKTIYYQTSLSPLYDENRNIIGVVGIGRDITTSKEIEKALKISEAKFKIMHENAPIGIALADFETGEIIDCNEELTRLVKRKKDEIIGQPQSILHPPNTIRGKFSQSFEAHRKSNPVYSLEDKVIDSEGKIIDVAIQASFLELSGKKYIQGFFVDVTERNNNLKTISESEERYKSLFEKSGAVMLLGEPETGLIVDVNEAAVKFYGYTREEFIGKNINEINTLSSEEIKFEMEKVHRGKQNHFVFKHKLANGNIRDVEVYSGHFNYAGRHILYSIVHDVTERLLVEKALKESELLLKNLTNQVPGVIYQFQYFADGKSCLPYASEGIEELFEIKPEDVKDDAAAIFSRIHEDDYNSFMESIKKSKDNLTIWETEFRVVLPKKGLRWIKGISKPIKQADGSVLWHGYVNDITQNKLSEKALKESEENFRLLFESMHDSFAHNEIVTDENGKPIDYIFRIVNPAFEKATGLKAKDIIGKRVKEVLPNTEDYWIETFGKVALDGTSLNYRNYSAEFDKYYETVVYQSKPRHFVVFFWDVTEEEKQKLALMQSEEMLRSVTDNSIDMVSKINEKFEITFASKSHEVFLGFKVKELIGKNPISIVHEDDKDRIEKIAQNAFKLISPPYFQSRLRRKDGGYIWIETSTKLLIENNKFAGAVLTSREITKRVIAEENLRKLQRAIDQSSASVVITNIDGEIEFVNPKFIEVTGYTKEESIGKNPRILSAGNQSKEFYQKLWDAIKAGKDWKGEFLNKRKDGTLFWETATISPIKDSNGKITHYVAIKDEITDQKKMQEELENHRLNLEKLVEKRTEDLERQNKFLQTLLDTIPSPVFVKNLKEEYIVVNKTFLDEVDTKKIDPIGKTVFDLYPKSIADYYHKMDQELFEKGLPQTYEYLYYDKNGKAKASVFHKNVIKHNNKITGMVGIVIDISERKAMEIQTKQALEQEKEWNELQKHLISMVSHEFRTPLTSILSSADFLEMFGARSSPEKTIVHIKRIQNGVNILTGMIEDVLTISRADRGKIQFNPETFDLLKLLHELIDETNIASGNKNKIELSYSINQNKIYYDEKIIHHIISNLLSNAVKYSEEDKKIEVAAEILDEQLILKVSDEGIGIPEKDIPHLFQPFSRATNTNGIDGHGLGLAIIKKFLDLVNGKFEVLSRVNEGSTFIIKLPLIKNEKIL